MTFQIAMFLLTICAAFTGLITEAIKKAFNATKPTIVALVVSVIVGIGVPVGYILINGLSFGVTEIVYLIAMVILTWLSATLSYDKVKQIIEQLSGVK